MNDTVIIFCAFLCAGLSCGQKVRVCCTVHKPGRLYAASIFQRLILHLLNIFNHTLWFLVQTEEGELGVKVYGSHKPCQRELGALRW